MSGQLNMNNSNTPALPPIDFSTRESGEADQFLEFIFGEMRHWRLRWRWVWFRWYCCSLIYHSSWRYLRPYKPNEPQGCPTLTVTPTVKPNTPQGCPTLTVAITVKLYEPQGRPTLTVTYTVKPNEPHGYSTLTVTITVKLAEPQGCLTLTAIVAVKLQVCPQSRRNCTYTIQKALRLSGVSRFRRSKTTSSF